MSYIWGLPLVRWSPYLKQVFAAKLLEHIQRKEIISLQELKDYANSRLHSDFPGCHRGMFTKKNRGDLDTRVDVATKYLIFQGAVEVVPGPKAGKHFRYLKGIVLGATAGDSRVEYLKEVIEIYRSAGRVYEKELIKLEQEVRNLRRGPNPILAEIILRRIEQLKVPDKFVWKKLEEELDQRGETAVLRECRGYPRGAKISPDEETTREENDSMGRVMINLQGKYVEVQLQENGQAVCVAQVKQLDYATDLQNSLDDAIENLRKQLSARRDALFLEVGEVESALEDLQATASRVRRMAAAKDGEE